MNELSVILDKGLNISIDEEELKVIAERLSANMNNKFFFNQEPYKAHNSVRIFENFEGQNLRQSYFENCIFEDANLNKSGLAGSIFLDCIFNPCFLKDTNLQSCDFRNCSFNNVKLEYTRMNKSLFYNTVFKDCIFSSASMNDSIFEKCEFINCQWTVSIENAVFKDTLLSNVRFKSMNFEFATFDNIKAENVKFPFPTIPFIYNGLTYIFTTDDNIRITSAQKKEGLTKKEYLEYIEDLKSFYAATQNYFPLVNIYVSQGNYSEAFSALVHGVKLSIHIRAFRMLKYYCKQIKYIDRVSPHQRQELYYFILNEISQCKLQDYEKRALNLYLPEVKELLYVEAQQDRLQVLLETNIKETDFDKIAVLMCALDKFLKTKCTYSIEFRHSSPFQGLLDILANPDNIGIIISGLSLILNITFGTINAIQNKKKIRIEEAEDCKRQGEQLKEQKIYISNIYIINNGDVYMNSHNSSQGNIYLNK